MASASAAMSTSMAHHHLHHRHHRHHRPAVSPSLPTSVGHATKHIDYRRKVKVAQEPQPANCILPTSSQAAVTTAAAEEREATSSTVKLPSRLRPLQGQHHKNHNRRNSHDSYRHYRHCHSQKLPDSTSLAKSKGCLEATSSGPQQERLFGGVPSPGVDPTLGASVRSWASVRDKPKPYTLKPKHLATQL